IPNCPLLSRPEDQAVPFLSIHVLNSPPPEAATAFVRFFTWTGVSTRTSSPLPSLSWPSKARPQPQAVPSAFMAKLWDSQAAIATTSVRSRTCTGRDRQKHPVVVVVAFPSSPSPSKPHAQTVPFDCRARLWAGGRSGPIESLQQVVASAVTFVRLLTWTGTRLSVVV